MLRTYPALFPCSATSQNWFPKRPSPTGVRLGFLVFRPLVSNNAYPGSGSSRPINGIARQLNPIHDQIFRKHPISYYWSTYQHEWALDIIFQQAADLWHFYPRWINHAMTTFSSPDVMRFLGKRITDVLVGRCALQPDEFLSG